MPNKYIAIDLGGTKCAAATISESGNVDQEIRSKIAGKQGDEVANILINLAGQLIQESRGEQIRGIGVSVPGISYKSKGTVWAPNIPGWEAYPLLEKLSHAFDYEYKVTIDNDRAASIMGEVWQGAAAGCQDAVYLAFGTGIGAGILSGGRIIQGCNDIAGAVGWLALDDKYHDGYKQFGCFEYNASGDGVARLARDLWQEDNSYQASFPNPDELNASSIFEGYNKGEPLAQRTVEILIYYWGKAAANFVSIFNPEKVIFGGGLFGPATSLIDQIYEEARKYAQPIAIEQATFCTGQLGSKAQLLGAAKLFMEDQRLHELQ